MEIITDSILEKGSSHDICEDYILHGITKEYNIPYIILSDGCSSSKHTDIGARILVHGIKKQIENHFCFLPEEMINDDMYNYLQPNIIYTANSIINSLQLANSCLDCTLIFAFIINEKCYIFRYGDGSIITEYDNGMININTLQFLKNNPYYLSYLLDNDINNNYFKNISTHYIEKITILENNQDLTFQETLKSINERSLTIIDLKDVKNLLITSDGIDSFLNKPTGKNIPVESLIHNMLDFKNLNGNFLKRTLKSKKGVLNQLKKENIMNADDLSIGCFNIIK